VSHFSWDILATSKHVLIP